MRLGYKIIIPEGMNDKEWLEFLYEHFELQEIRINNDRIIDLKTKDSVESIKP